MHGRVGVNEHSLDRNLNFESRITTGGFRFIYNFDQFLAPDRGGRTVQMSLGFETVGSCPRRTTWTLKEGLHNYWSDGTIRDIRGMPLMRRMPCSCNGTTCAESDIRNSTWTDSASTMNGPSGSPWASGPECVWVAVSTCA